MIERYMLDRIFKISGFTGYLVNPENHEILSPVSEAGHNCRELEPVNGLRKMYLITL